MAKRVTRTDFLYMGERWRHDPFNGRGFTKGGPVIRLRSKKAPCKNGKGANNLRKTEPAG